VFGIGGTELVLILLFAFIIFGPDKLPGMGRTIGRALRQFRNAQDEMNKVIKTEVYDPLNDTDPLKNPFDSGGAKKKSNSAAAAGQEETFAERKARMTREKEAARAAKEQADAAKAKPSTPEKAKQLYDVTAPSATSSEAAKAAKATADAAKAADSDGKEGGKEA